MRAHDDDASHSVRSGHQILGVPISHMTYEEVVDAVAAGAASRIPMRVTALAVHGLVEASRDPEMLFRLRRFSIVTADGQPVRWALQLLFGKSLPERVYGPTLMLKVCARAASDGEAVYLYGATPEILSDLERSLLSRFPGLRIAGSAPSEFGQVDLSHFETIAGRIARSGASILFSGLGCPRQEAFVDEIASLVSMPSIAVGAAFEYHAGHKVEPPMWIQRSGLQWLHRLLADPGRLWRRYASTNPRFVLGVSSQRLGFGRVPKSRQPKFAGWA